MGCTYSKTPKKVGRTLLSVKNSSKSTRSGELKTAVELPTKKLARRRTREQFVYPTDEVTPLSPEPPPFIKKQNKRQKLDSIVRPRDFAVEDKEVFLANRRRVKERRKRFFSQEEEDTLFEQPTRMPEMDFTGL